MQLFFEKFQLKHIDLLQNSRGEFDEELMNQEIAQRINLGEDFICHALLMRKEG
jgi:hypothetical protein